MHRLRSLVRGSPDDPVWYRPGLIVLLVGTGVLYLWALDASGYGNEYYAAASYSGSLDWSSWLFGSIDTADFITVDKPPLSLWVTGLSIRLFGLSSWSVLVPHALAGVASVGVLSVTVRRWHSAAAGLIAGMAMAVTPVSLVIFRYNNPDAVLTLLMVSSVALGFDAIRKGSRLRLVGVGVLVGLGFLTKTTQALLVVPAIAGVYLAAAPIDLRRRVVDVALAGAAVVVAAGWWISIVAISDGPFFGGTESGSFLEYVFGYNGLGRIFGQDGPASDPFGGGPGVLRLVNDQVGGQIAWLLPAAFVLPGLGLWWTRGVERTDSVRTGWLLWGGVMVIQVIVFSAASGIFHPYYTVTLAPAVAALVAAGSVEVFGRREHDRAAAVAGAAVVVASAVWAAVLLRRTPDFAGPLWIVVLIGGIVAAGLVGWGRRNHTWTVAAAALVIVTLAAGPLAYAVETIGVDYSGGDPKAGPSGNVLPAPGGGADIAAGQPGPPADRPADRPAGPQGPGGGVPGALPRPGDGGLVDRPGIVGPGGGVGPDATLDDETVAYLVSEFGDETWMVAVVGSQTGADVILRTGEPVMVMGGFRGDDPAPTSEELAEAIDAKQVRFVVLSGGGGAWSGVVSDRCDPVDVHSDGRTSLFDCAG